jgi:hypothetical protein
VTRRLQVQLAAEPADRIAADVLAVAWRAQPPGLGGVAAGIDWRLCGRLSGLMEAGTLDAETAVLLPSGGGVRAALVLALPLASGEGALGAWSEDATARALRLEARRVALALPGSGASLDEAVASLVAGACRAWAACEADDAAVLELWLSTDPEDTPGAGRVLRGLQLDDVPEGVALSVCLAAERPSASAPSGGRPAASPIPALVK